MAAIEIIKRNGKNFDAYTDEEREIVKAYGWAEYGLGFADTIRAELDTFDYESYLDATFC
jgi:hypothetical protein